jgi:hypothetical protein
MTANARLSQIEHAALGMYDKYDVATKKRDEARGRKDGEQNFPGLDDQTHHFMEELIGQARSSLKKCVAQLLAYLHELETREASLSKRIEENLATEREQIDDRYQENRDAIERAYGSSSSKQSTVRAAFDHARDRAQEIEIQLGRPLRIHLRWLYVPIMVLVALSEVPINRFAFELYFSESPLISFGIALTIGLIFALFAHFLGTWIKRAMHYEARNRIIAILGASFILIILLPTIYVIALMREHYVQFIERSSTSLKDLIQNEGLTSVASQVASAELSTSGWTLLMLNIVVLSIGAIASVVRHDEHPDFENMVRQQERLARNLKKIVQRYEKDTARVQKAYEARKEAIDKSYSLAADELELTKSQIRQCRAHSKTAIDRVSTYILQRVNSYEYANRKARPDKTAPKCFGTSEQDLTKELTKLVEDDNSDLVSSVQPIKKRSSKSK